MQISKAEYATLVKKGLVPAVQVPEKAERKYKSKDEAAYAAELDAMVANGILAWWAYEPFSMDIASSCGKSARYSPDFMLVFGPFDGRVAIEFVEVKGFLREAARIRFLAAAERYWMFRFRMVRKGKGGTFETIMDSTGESK